MLLGGRAALERLAPPTEQVLVASHDLAAGASLAPGDLRGVERARVVRGPGRRSRAGAVGQLLAGPVRAGEEITVSRLVGPGLLSGQPPGSRGLWLPAAGAGSLTGIGPGSRVDVHVSGSSAPVLRDVVVLARTGAGSSAAGLLDTEGREAAGLLLAAPAADAGRVLATDLGEVGAFRFAIAGG